MNIRFDQKGDIIVSAIKDRVFKDASRYNLLFHIYNFLNPKNHFKIGRFNLFTYTSCLFSGVRIKVFGTGNRIIMGELCNLKRCTIYIYGNNNTISFGDKVYMNQTDIRIENDNNEMDIGSSSSFTARVHLAAIESTRLHIGEDCMFSTDIHVRTGDSHSILDENGKRVNYPKEVVFGNHVWVGTRVVCLKDVVIPNQCIIGANALLTKKFTEENCVIAGNPARIIKRNQSWVREQI